MRAAGAAGRLRSSWNPATPRCSSRCVQRGPPPSQERIEYVVGIAVKAFVAANDKEK
jgi:hypothetical protein